MHQTHRGHHWNQAAPTCPCHEDLVCRDKLCSQSSSQLLITDPACGLWSLAWNKGQIACDGVGSSGLDGVTNGMLYIFALL
jgi:hypothetical protein